MVSVRPPLSIIVPGLALLIAALPVHAQELPAVPVEVPAAPGIDVVGPAAPQWIGTHQGVPYYVLDGVVQRHDGLPVPGSVAHAVQMARRATDLLAADPAFVHRLSQGDAEAQLQQALAQVAAVSGHLRSAASLLDSTAAGGLLSGVLPSLAFEPDRLAEEADAVAADVASAQAHLDRLAAARAAVASALDQYEDTHAVEDKVALYQAYADAIPAYEAAAAGVSDARATAEGAAARAAIALADIESKATGLLGIRLPVEAPAKLAAATDGLMDAAAPLHAAAGHLREDAAFMAMSLAEPEPPALPVAWVVGGSLGAVGAGAGGLYWLRRRLGLP